jgi:hypothetical protein
MATAATSALTRTAIVVAARMVVAVVVTGRTRDIGKFSRKERVYSLIGIAAYSREHQYSRFGKRTYCTAADTAAYKRGDFIFFQILGESAMTADVGCDNCGGRDLSTDDIIDFELFGMPEMIENVSVFKSYCYFHFYSLFDLFGQYTIIHDIFFFSREKDKKDVCDILFC